MSASLVGSEMCIRDRVWDRLKGSRIALNTLGASLVFDGSKKCFAVGSVSYTHLTLPTICSV
eukprot:12447852-Alexandrium_andersonii.AAC.1